jgi:hypothetical protein
MNLTFYTLTIIMQSGSVLYGYHFTEKANCEKVGRELAKSVKGKYVCKKDGKR